MFHGGNDGGNDEEGGGEPLVSLERRTRCNCLPGNRGRVHCVLPG